MGHANIVPLLATWQQGHDGYILLPCAQRNLKLFMKEVQAPGHNMEAVLWLLQQMKGLSDAIRLIHGISLIRTGYHHDIKPDNILLFAAHNGHYVFKIADFGCARMHQRTRKHDSEKTPSQRGTVRYQSPDGDRNNGLSRPNDIWSIGCVFLELMDWFCVPLGSRYIDPEQNPRQSKTTSTSQKNTSQIVTDQFWETLPSTSKESCQYRLRGWVTKAIEGLQHRYCAEVESFQHIIHMIKGCLQVDRESRFKAVELYGCMAEAEEQAASDFSGHRDVYVKKHADNCSREQQLSARKIHME